MSQNRPAVLCFSGHDPSGGAGIQADIETIVSHHCHCSCVITALTEQDTRNVKKLIPQQADDIIRQAETLMADISFSAVKIGLIGHVDTAKAIQTILKRHPKIPVVLDPVLAAGGGAEMSNQALLAAMIDLLLPLTTVLTPNSQEARQLAKLENLVDCGRCLQAKGSEFVLITGSHEASELVHNQLFMPDEEIQTFNWERLPHSYHGSGCTLASAIAALLAQGLDPFTAISEAQEFTWQALQAAYRPGQGQHNPDRLFLGESIKFPRRGLYAITQTEGKSIVGVVQDVEAALKGGAAVIQYRDKQPLDLVYLGSLLLEICHRYHVPLLINDNVDLALQLGADGVHLGKDDSEIAHARQQLGPHAIIGISCYNDLKKAQDMQAKGADYVAFGRFFPSTSKPLAAPAQIATLKQAKQCLTIPIVAIGGILPENAGQLLSAGADLLAVIGGVFDREPEAAAQAYQALFNNINKE